MFDVLKKGTGSATVSLARLDVPLSSASVILFFVDYWARQAMVASASKISNRFACLLVMGALRKIALYRSPTVTAASIGAAQIESQFGCDRMLPTE